MMFKWAENNIKKMSVWDFSLMKLNIMFFTLMIAKLFPPILGLAWYWYGILAVIVYLIVLRNVLSKTFKT